MPRSDAAKLCINNLAPQVSVEAFHVDIATEEGMEAVKGTFEEDSGLMASFGAGGGSAVDIVLDSLQEPQREELNQLCVKAAKTRVEFGLSKEAACAFYRFHVEGAVVEQVFIRSWQGDFRSTIQHVDDEGGFSRDGFVTSGFQVLATVVYLLFDHCFEPGTMIKVRLLYIVLSGMRHVFAWCLCH